MTPRAAGDEAEPPRASPRRDGDVGAAEPPAAGRDRRAAEGIRAGKKPITAGFPLRGGWGSSAALLRGAAGAAGGLAGTAVSPERALLSCVRADGWWKGVTRPPGRRGSISAGVGSSEALLS